MASILSRSRNIKVEPKKTRADYAEDALYREVWEDINNEKTTAFIKKYYKYIVAAAIALVLAMTAFTIVRSFLRNREIAVVQNYESALMSGDVGALSAIGQNESGATADLALFQSWMLDKDVKKLEQLADNGNTKNFRDLARLHLAGINGDKMTADEFADFMSPLNTKNSPYYYDATLLVAQKYLATDDRASAQKYLEKIITDDKAPAVIKSTAESLK